MHIANKDIVHLLRSVAAAYELTGVNRFRIIAYQKAADTVEHFNQELFDIWENGNLSSVEGIGPTISQHLDEHFRAPEKSYLTEQISKIPLPVYELMKAPGIGPKKAFRIVMEFGFHDPKTIFEDVLKLVKENKISPMEGFGEKSQEDIAQAIYNLQEKGDQEDRMPLPIAFALAQDVIAYMRQNPYVEQIEPLGSLRRMVTTIGDVDLAVIAKKGHEKDIIDFFVQFPQKLSIEGQGKSKASIIVKSGRRIDLGVIDGKRYGSMLQYFTGSKAHNIKLREFALKKGLSLNEFGIKNVTSGKVETFSSEEAFYKKIGLDYVPPEIREGTDEVKLAQQHKLPALVELKDIRGEFHIHSSFDIETSHDVGANSIEEMVEKAQDLGYEYLAFSEHNPSVSNHTKAQMAALVKQKKEAIEKVQKKFPDIHLLNSMEIDIQPSGDLALSQEAFEHLDLAVVSIHSSFRMKKEDMTKRILKALDHPKVKIFGHPTARKLPSREEIDVDWDAVFEFAQKRNIALEVNSWTDRLDLPDTMARRAIKAGCKLIINTDAHAAIHMDNIFYGVSVARRGWAQKSDIINTQTTKKILEWIAA